MTSTIINYIIDKYLANILEINTDKTNSSLWSGVVELKDLKIKPQIFDTLQLPYFELANGYVGSLKVEMQLPRFYAYPIKIFINKVFFHCRQKSLNKLNEKEVIKSMESYKQSKLQAIEEMTSEVTKELSNEPGMVGQIMNNLMIEVGEIVFRFEDDISYPSNPFVFGMILHKLLIKTTTDKYEEQNTNVNIPISAINHKLIKVSGFHMFLDLGYSKERLDLTKLCVGEEKAKLTKEQLKFLDSKSLIFYVYCMSELNHHSKNIDYHHNLLYDFGTSIQIAMNDKIKENLLPQLQSNILIESVILNIELKQVSVIFKLLAYFNLNNLYRIGIYKNFYNKELTLDEKKAYLDKYIEYYKFKYIKEFLDTKKAESLKTDLIKNEEGFTYDQIQSMRQAALIKLDYIIQINNIENKIAEVKGRYRFTSYFRGQDNEAELSNYINMKDKLKGSESELEQKIQEQLALEKGAEIDIYKDLPIDYVLNNFNLQLKKCVLSIGETDTRKLIDLVFTKFEVVMLLGLTFQNVVLYLDEFCVNQHKFKHPYFNNIIESYEDESRLGENIDVIDPQQALDKFSVKNVINSFANKKGALYIEFENNPANELCNYRFKLRNEKRLYIFANLYVLQYIQTKVLEALQSNIDLNELSNYAKGEAYKYIEEGYVNKIFSGEYQHFNISLDLILKGPMIIMPQNIHDTSNSSCMILSFGECQISSALPPRMNPNIDYIKLNDMIKMYDVYTIRTQGFQLSTMTDYTNLGSIGTSNTKLNILDDVNVELKFGNLIQPKNLFFENFKMGIKIGKIQIFLRDIQIEFMIYLLQGMAKMNKLLALELAPEKKEIVDISQLNQSNTSNQYDQHVTIPESSSTSKMTNEKDETSSKRPLTRFRSMAIAAKSMSTALRKKEKIFFNMEFILTRIDFYILKSLTPDEQVIYDKTGKKMFSPFKNYLHFIMNKFDFSLSISEKKNMKFNLKIHNMFLYDTDFIYRLENNSPVQDLLIHPEFQCLIGSINDDENYTIDHQSRSASLLSEAHGDPKISAVKSFKSFIQFDYNYNSIKNKSKIQVNFTKLLIAINLSSCSRLLLFSKYYSNMYTNVNKNDEKINFSKKMSLSLKKEIDELKDVKESKKAIKGGGNNINNKFFKKVMAKMDERSKVNNNSVREGGMVIISDVHSVKNSEINTNTKVLALFSRSKSIATTTAPDTYTVREKVKMKFSFEMKEIELNIPLNANSENTKMLKLNFNMTVKLNQESEYDKFQTVKENKLIKMNYIVNKMNMNLMIFNVDFDIINFKNSVFIRNPLSDKIVSNSRLTCSIKSFIIPDKETSVNSIDLHIEPITMIIGFRQVKILTKYMNSYYEFNENMQKEYKALAEREPAVSESVFREKIMKKIEEVNDKLENQIKYNITSFNNLTDLNFRLDKANIKMIDNTSYYTKPLTKIECSKIAFKYISNSDPCDSDNMAQALVEMISRKEINQYNIYNLFQYMDACYNIEILSFNQKVSDWEPILEPWNGTIKMTQVHKMTRLKVDYVSDIFFNLNLSFNSVQVLNNILNKLSQTEDDWVEEDNIFYAKDKKEITLKSLRSNANTGNEEISMEFVNSSGVELKFWFDADKTKIFELKPNGSCQFTKNEISAIYKKLTDNEMSLIKKDKFTLSLLNCKPVESIDFSFNHYSNIRIENGNEFEFVEVSIKIKNSGLIKSISIESNLQIYNNTPYKIGIHVVKSEEFIKKYNENVIEPEYSPKELTSLKDNTSNNQDNVVNFSKTGVETIEPNSFIKIPLTWMIHGYLMLGRIIENNNITGNNAYRLLYEELNFTYKLGEEYKAQLINDDNEQENSKEKEKAKQKSITDQFSSKYSKVVSFEYENKNINLLLDLMITKSSADTDKQILSKSEIYKKTFSYILILNPPIVLENQIPYSLGFSYGRKSEEIYNLSTLIPLQKLPIFYINYFENKSDAQLTLNYFSDINFKSDYFSLLDNVQENKKIIKLYRQGIPTENINSSDFYNITIEYQPTEVLNIFNYNFSKLERNLSKSVKLICYVDYLIVNKLDLKLLIKSNNSNNKGTSDEELSTNNTIYAGKVNLFNLPPKEDKARIKSGLSSWSQPFRINTHGVDGVISLDTDIDNEIDITCRRNTETLNSDLTYVTDIGMLITSSSWFNHSTLVILQPHYMLVNKLGINLNYRQMFTKDSPCNDICEIISSETKILAFKKNTKKSKNLLKYCQFSLPSRDSDFALANENWSPTVNLESLDEFNIKLPIPKYEYERIKNTNPTHVFTYDDITHFLLVRVIIHSNDTVLIYIIITTPKHPQFLIRNNSEHEFVIKQMNVDKKLSPIIIRPNVDIPFTWSDLLMPEKKIIVGINSSNSGDQVKFCFDKLEKLKEIKIKTEDENNHRHTKSLFFSVLMDNKYQTRVLKIQQQDYIEEVKEITEIFTGKKVSKIFKVNLSFKGVAISIIDENPREVFYISMYCFDLRYSNNFLQIDQNRINTENIEIYIKNFQIDYCLEDSFKLLLYPKSQIIPSNEKEKEKEGDIVPFVSLLITRKHIHNLVNLYTTSKISQIDFTMQDLNVKIDQSVLNTLLELVGSFSSVLTYKAESSSNSSKKHLPGENDSSSSQEPGDFCPYLITTIESYDKIISTTDESNMVFIEALMLSGIRINLTLRIDITSLEINRVPGFIVKILGTIGNALARITDSPLRFSELILMNCFTDSGRMISKLQSHYTKQGIIQFYKILGSSDLLGNPVGLVDKLGTGFMEFFNEPRKGFLNGPKQFGQGIAKGLNSLVSNVVGGGFDTIGKITGTLLVATKNLKGEKVEYREEDEPDNLLAGAYEGVKGGFKEIGMGLAGIFINPYKSAKKDGLKGFFKGVGTGLLGAIISPFSAVLKVGNSVAVGLKNTATTFSRGKLKTERIRHPRHIMRNEPLKPYDENYAEVQAILRHLGDVTDNKLIFFADFQYIDPNFGKEVSTIILTDKRIMVVYNAKEMVYDIDIRVIKNTEVHIILPNFIIVFYLIDGSKKYILTPNMEICCQIHGILQKLLKA